MRKLPGLSMLVVFLATAAMAQAPTGPWRGSPQPQDGRYARPAGQPTAPGQPVGPAVPTLQRRPPAGQPQYPAQAGQALGPRAPFQLNPQQQAQVDQVLAAWEARSSNIKRFESGFTRFEYDPVFGDERTPRFVEQGELKYAAPDKGVFRVAQDIQGGKPEPVHPSRAEHWICDGKSVFQYDFTKEQLVEHKLPPGMQGKAIANSPLPFLFGLEAAKLKQRYFVRVTTPADVQGQVWLEAYPRFQADAANFRRAEIILSQDDMLPMALQMYMPNGKNRKVYTFRDIKINAANPLDPLGIFADAPFRPQLPRGWKWVVEEAPGSTQAARPASTQRR